jgi:hypothetical protein
MLLVFASAVILRSESRRTHDHILLSQIRDSPNLEGQVPQEQGGPVIPQVLGLNHDIYLKIYKIQSVPQRKHIAFSVLRPIGYCCLGIW